MRHMPYQPPGDGPDVRMHYQAGAGGEAVLDGSGLRVSVGDTARAIWVLLTARISTPGSAIYSWLEVEGEGGATITDLDGGLSGTFSGGGAGAAYEVNGNHRVPVGNPGGALVWLWPAGDGVKWLFAYEGPGGEEPDELSLSGTQQNDVAISPGVTDLILTTTSATSISGFAGVEAGDWLVVTNSANSTATATLLHDSSSSASGNRLTLPGGLSYPIPPGKSVRLVGHPTDGTLYVDEPLAFRPHTPSLSGTHNDYAVAVGATSLVPTLTGTTTITGLAGLPVGVPFAVVNPRSNTHTLTLSHEAAGSAAANRFDLSGGASVALSPGESLSVMNDGARLIDIASSVSKPAGSGVSGSGAAGNITKFAATPGTIEASTIAEGATYAGTVAREWVTSVVWVVGSGGSLTAPDSANGFSLSCPTSSTMLMNIHDAGGTIQATLTVRHVSGEARVELDGLGDPAKFFANGVEIGGGGTGTVTSVGLTVPSGLSVSGSPITSSGTLAVTVTDAAAFRSVIGAGTGSGTVTSVGITAPAAGITVSGSPVTGSGSMTLALADDLAALEAMSGTGVVARTAANTYAQRTITAGANISVTNGDGVSGNPTVAVTGLAAVATSGSAADLGAGTLLAARMPALTGDVTTTAGSTVTAIAAGVIVDADINAGAAIGWTKVSKTGSSLADLATRSAGDLSSGTLLAARMPALTGDVTTTAGAVATTIANNAVTNARLADMVASRIKARITGSTGDPEDATITQVLDLAGSANGDTLIRSAGTWTRLAIGTNGRRLRVASALPSWVIDSGRVLDRSYVATAEATTSTTAVGLTTAQSFTVVPDESVVVQIEAEAACILDTTNASARLWIFDGTTNHEVSIATVAVATGAVQLRGSLIQTISASRTYTLRFSVTSGSSGTFSARLLKASIIA